MVLVTVGPGMVTVGPGVVMVRACGLMTVRVTVGAAAGRPPEPAHPARAAAATTAALIMAMVIFIAD